MKYVYTSQRAVNAQSKRTEDGQHYGGCEFLEVGLGACSSQDGVDGGCCVVGSGEAAALGQRGIEKQLAQEQIAALRFLWR